MSKSPRKLKKDLEKIDSTKRELQKVGIIIKTSKMFVLTYYGKQKKITFIA